MNTWERLQQGLVYNDFDEDLFNRRVEAKKLFRAYNATDDDQVELREELMRKLFGSVGQRVWIEPDFKCEFGSNIHIEDDVYINFGCVILDCAQVTIGEHTLLGPNVGLYAANHSTDAQERIRGACYGKPIHIEKNCWLGGDVKVTPGVTIGEGTIIGTGSIVTRDIPAGVIAVGNPCHALRPITDADKTDYLDIIGD